MNYLTIVAQGGEKQAEELLKSFEEHGGGELGDALMVLCSIYNAEFNSEFKERASEYFDSVIMIPRSLIPFAESFNSDEYSEEMLAKNALFIKASSAICYFPFGRVPSEGDWSKLIINEYRRAGKKFMGHGTLINKEANLYAIEGAFVCPTGTFQLNPAFRAYNKEHSCIYRAHNYTHRSLNLHRLPFRRFDSEPAEKPVEVSEPTFDVNTPRKIDALPPSSSGEPEPKAPAAKKVAKKAKKKTAKKKVAKKAPIKPLSDQ